MCCGEALTPVNSPAIANLCGIWIESIWFTKGQADALQFANTVVRRILQPLLKTKQRNEDMAFIVALWLPSNSSRRISNSYRSIDNTRVDFYDIDPASHLRRFIKILSQCPDPKSKKLTREPSYMLPLDYHDDGHIPDGLLLFSPGHQYRFIYSIEKKPGLRHLLYLFQGETIRDFERIISSVGQPQKSIDRETAKYCYVVDFRFKPSFPQFGIEGDQDAINRGIRAPPLPRDTRLVETTSNDTEEKEIIKVHIFT